MAHSFRFSSKLRIFETQANMTFSMMEKGTFAGMLEFEGKGMSIDTIIRRFWKQVAGKSRYPFPKFNARIKTISTQMYEHEQGSMFMIQTLVNQVEISIFFTKNQNAASTQIISISTINPIVLENLPGVDAPLEEPIVVNFTFHLASQDTTVHFDAETSKVFKRGFSYDLDLKLPEVEQETFNFAIPNKEEAMAAHGGRTPEAVEAGATADTGGGGGMSFDIPKVLWHQLDKKVGPATFYKVGLTMEDEKIWVLLNVDFSFANLTLALKGLRMGSSMDNLGKDVFFGLEGIGIAYHSPFFGIVGLLIEDKENEQYAGSITIRSKFISIFGAGAYGKIDGNNSVFVYALVDYPLGGPPFFFVEGLALGFGYNRLVNIPTIDKLSEFPLIQQAVGNTPAIQQGKLLENLSESLAEAFPPSVDNLFLAIGVKFSSFKLLDAFLLVVVGFGERLKFDIIGIGALTLPPMLDKPQVYIELVMKTAFLPDEGAVKIQGSISPNSFVLSDNARLSGGFAFYLWFKDSEDLSTRAGDFVLTLGGYHPRYDKPAHYPDVPPIDLTWYVTEDFYLKGQSYFALTPGAVMLGGTFKAIYTSNNFKAAFDFEMDLLAQWKPFFYDFRTTINAQIEFSAKILRVHKKVSMDVGAELELWGPDFSGKADVKVKTFGINFHFGIEFGSKEEVNRTIDWDSFKEGFLPDDDKVVTVNVIEGLNESSESGIEVNPKDLILRVESLIPATGLDIDEEEEGTAFGIYPMGLGEVTSEFSIEVSDEDAEFELVEMVHKNVPAALWSNRETLELNDPSMVNDTLSGFTLKAAEPIFDDEIELNTSSLKNEVAEHADVWDWNGSDMEDTFDFEAMTDSYKSEFHLLKPHHEELKSLRSKVMVVNGL